MVTYNRTNQILTTEERPIETKGIDDDFMRKYDEMYKLMQYKQTHDYYEAWRHICRAHYSRRVTCSAQKHLECLQREAGLLTELLLKYPLLPRGGGGATGTVRLRLSKQ